MFQRCCGLDIGQREVVCCLLMLGAGGSVETDIRRFGTSTAQLLQLRDWLVSMRCEHVAMESTGPYWQPIWNILEGHVGLTLVNPAHMKAVPGRKTDVKDAEWIADLLSHGLLTPSYVPGREQRDLRELIRYRRSIIEERAREANRIQKVLEGANIKFSSVASDVLGVSGRDILKQLAAGNEDPVALADLARGRLREKREELIAALTGLIQPHQRYMLRHQLEHVFCLDGMITHLDEEVAQRLVEAKKVLERLRTIPGVGERTAQVIVAEVGADVSHFPSADHAASWAGVTPGQNESAGKRKSARSRPGNKSLRNALVEAARAASRTKNTHLAAQHERLSRHLKGKKATVALAHTLMIIIYHILKNGTVYQELGADCFVERDRKAMERNAFRTLDRLGYDTTTLKPKATA